MTYKILRRELPEPILRLEGNIRSRLILRESTGTTVKHRLIVVSIILALLIPGLVAFTPLVQDGNSIDLSVDAGYSGYFRKGQWAPVLISVSNTGDNLTGEIRVRTGKLSGLAETTYLTPVDLPRNSRKQLFLYISLEGYKQQIQVELLDRSGRVVKQEDEDIRAVDRGDVLSAVITDSSFGAVDLTAYSPGSGQVLQANWQIDNIPPLADALTGLDVMLFHDVDTGTLSADQSLAIQNWVLTGGHLIVTGGDAWQRTTAAFSEVLPVSLNGSETLDSLTPLGDYLRQPSDGLDEEITATRNTPNSASARILAAAGDIPLLVRDTYGEGLIDFLAVDPFAEPLRSWAAQDQLWYTLLSSRGQRPSWTRGFNNWDTAREATLTTSSTTLPTFVQLCGFLVLYVLLIGPVNYLVLKRLNRRELAWITIPVLILGFSAIAYSVGFNLRGNVATVNRLTVVRVWDESEQAQVISLIGVQSPRRSDYEIVTDRGYMLRTLPDRGTGLNVPAAISEETQYAAKSIPIDAGMVASFAANGYTEAPGLDVDAAWLLSNNQPPRLEGSLTNTTDMVLEDAVLLVKGESRYLGSLEPGETSRFDVGLGPQDPGPLTLGNQLSQYNIYPLSWSYSPNSPGWCFSAAGLWLTVPDVMRNEAFSCEGGIVPGGDQETRRRYRLLASLIYDTDVSGGRDANAYVFAWGSKTPFEVDLPGKPQAYEDSTLYIFQLPVSVIGQTELVEVPPSMTLWSAIELDDPNTLPDLSPLKFRISNDGKAAFRFIPMPAMHLETVEELEIKFQGQGPLTVQLWNWDEQQWVGIRMNPDSDSTTVSNPEPFIGPENAVNVRVGVYDTTLYNQVDYIEVAYRGRLAG